MTRNTRNILSRLLGLLAMVGVGFGAASCGQTKESTEAEVTLSVVSSDIVFQSAGGTGSILVRSTAGTVTASSERPWLTVTVAGNSVQLTAEPNNDLENRYSVVKMSNGVSTVSVTVHQYGYKSSSFTAEDINASWQAVMYSFPYDYEQDITATSDVDWIIAAPSLDDEGNKSLHITIGENLETAARSGNVSWQLGLLSGTIAVNQSGWEFTYTFQPDWTIEYGEAPDAQGETVSMVKLSGIPGYYGVAHISDADYQAAFASAFDAETYVKSIITGGGIPQDQLLSGSADYYFDEQFAAGDHYIAVLGYDNDFQPTGKYSFLKVSVEGPDNRTPYEMWLGTWEVTRGDYTDVWTITPKVVDASYTISGFEQATLQAAGNPETYPFEALFDAATGNMMVRGQGELGTWEREGVEGEVRILGRSVSPTDGNAYVITGTYVVFSASLGENGTATLNPGTVNISSWGQPTPIAEAAYFAFMPDNSIYSFNYSSPLVLPATIKQLTRADGTGGGGGGEPTETTYDSFLGSWNGTPALQISAKTDGSTYTVEGMDYPVEARFNSQVGRIEFYYHVIGPYPENTEKSMYLMGMDQDGYLEEGEQSGANKGLLAYGTLSGNSLNIVGNKYVAVYSGTSYDEDIVTLAVFWDGDQEGYFGWNQNGNHISLPASFSKAGTTSLSSTGAPASAVSLHKAVSLSGYSYGYWQGNPRLVRRY